MSIEHPVIDLSRQVARLLGCTDVLEDVAKRIASAAGRVDLASVDIPDDACSVEELAETLEQLADILMPIAAKAHKLANAIPRPN